jgi:hypothetical protein
MQATEDRQDSNDTHDAHENALGHYGKEQRKAGDQVDRLHDGQEKPALANDLVRFNGGRL